MKFPIEREFLYSFLNLDYYILCVNSLFQLPNIAQKTAVRHFRKSAERFM